MNLRKIATIGLLAAMAGGNVHSLPAPYPSKEDDDFERREAERLERRRLAREKARAEAEEAAAREAARPKSRQELRWLARKGPR
jgi:hypothetical protein